MYDVSAQGIDEHMINVHYYYHCYYYYAHSFTCVHTHRHNTHTHTHTHTPPYKHTHRKSYSKTFYAALAFVLADFDDKTWQKTGLFTIIQWQEKNWDHSQSHDWHSKGRENGSKTLTNNTAENGALQEPYSNVGQTCFSQSHAYTLTDLIGERDSVLKQPYNDRVEFTVVNNLMVTWLKAGCYPHEHTDMAKTMVVNNLTTTTNACSSLKHNNMAVTDGAMMLNCNTEKWQSQVCYRKSIQKYYNPPPHPQKTVTAAAATTTHTCTLTGQKRHIQLKSDWQLTRISVQDNQLLKEWKEKESGTELSTSPGELPVHAMLPLETGPLLWEHSWKWYKTQFFHVAGLLYSGFNSGGTVANDE